MGSKGESRKSRLNIDEIFEEYLSVLPERANNLRVIPQRIFIELLSRVKTSDDIKHMKNIITDYLWHRNRVYCTNLDKFMKIGLEIDPISMLDLLEYHRQLLYYPHPEIMSLYTEFFTNHKDYQGFGKKFIDIWVKEHWLKKDDKFYNTTIDCANKNGDKLTVERLYANILDYSETKLSTQSINILLDSVDLINKDLIDHIVNYTKSQNIPLSFCSYVLIASNYGLEQDKMNEYLNKAIDHGKKTGDCLLIKSEKIKEEIIIKHKGYNSAVHNLIKSFDASAVFPEDPNFYDWKIVNNQNEGSTEKVEQVKEEVKQEPENKQ